jgi:hypothetical protein
MDTYSALGQRRNIAWPSVFLLKSVDVSERQAKIVSGGGKHANLR